MRSLDTEQYGWRVADLRRSRRVASTCCSRAMFDVGKILVTGGAFSSADSRVIDINGSTPRVTETERLPAGAGSTT